MNRGKSFQSVCLQRQRKSTRPEGTPAWASGDMGSFNKALRTHVNSSKQFISLGDSLLSGKNGGSA